MTIIIGIDPGMKGGICVYALPLDKPLFVHPMPVKKVKVGNGRKSRSRNVIDTMELITMIEKEALSLDTEFHIFIENIMSFSNRMAHATLNFGKEWGKVYGLLTVMFRKEPTLVSPQSWKKHIFGSIKTYDNKQLSIDKVKELFPDVDLRPTKRCSTDSDGMAESVLIAVYGESLISESLK